MSDTPTRMRVAEMSELYAVIFTVDGLDFFVSVQDDDTDDETPMISPQAWDEDSVEAMAHELLERDGGIDSVRMVRFSGSEVLAKWTQEDHHQQGEQ